MPDSLLMVTNIKISNIGKFKKVFIRHYKMDLSINKKVTISGSYRKFPEEIKRDMKEFMDYGADVVSPASMQGLYSHKGFVSLKGDPIERIDNLPLNKVAKALRLIEDSHLNAIKCSDLLWLTLPEGYLGTASAFEIGWALAHKVPVYALYKNISKSNEPIISYVDPVLSIAHVMSMPKLHEVSNDLSERMKVELARYMLRNELNASIAVGAIIIEHDSIKGNKQKKDAEILLVKTHKWHGRFSIVGGRILNGEDLIKGLIRNVKSQTSLEGKVKHLICAFNMIPNSGYYKSGANRIYIDNLVEVNKKEVILDDKAEEYIWILPENALKELDLEPNAKVAIGKYFENCIAGD
jgi:ADP-ribose pyrophosphatase YjhB (NUDIX family)